MRPRLTFFINCLGTYFFSIIGEFSEEYKHNPLLLYLQDFTPEFHERNLYDIKKSYGDNPWGYQPIGLFSADHTPIGIDEHFVKYLSQQFNITVDKHEVTSKNEFTKWLQMMTKPYFYGICSVDEFYLNNVNVFFKVSHNKHFLLMKSIDFNNNLAEVIDSERADRYTLTLDNLSEAHCNAVFHHKSVYSIDCSNIQTKVIPMFSDGFTSMRFATKNCIMSLIRDMREKQIMTGTAEDYFFKGYRYNILSKLLPWNMMRMSVYSIIQNEESYGQLAKIMKMWQDINYLMHFQILRNDYSFGEIIRRLEQLVEQEII